MKHASLRRIAEYVVKTECLCKGAILPYEDGTRECPHDLARKFLKEQPEENRFNSRMK